MKRWIRCLVAVSLLSALSAGCVGFGESAKERNHRWAAVANRDARGLVADTDLLLQTDRPSRLNKWHSQ